MPLVNTLANYRASITQCAHNLNIAFNTDVAGAYIYAQPQRDFIIESSFLKFFISWEKFLENAFLDFLVGEPSIRGTVISRHAIPISRSHAHKILIGTQKYVDWANPEIVRRLSKLYFDITNPIETVISAIQTDIYDLKTIRNAAAHISSTTSHEIDALATRKLQRQCINFTVSQLILAFDPAAAVNTQTFLTTYTNLLDAAAYNIANA